MVEECVIVSIILFICEWFFFRNVIGTANGALIGDRGDGRFTTLIAEHWWRFIQGKEGFSELSIYYPYQNILGYSDLLLGYGIVHSFLRLIGFNMFSAYKWTLIIYHVFGTVSMYYLLRKTLKCHTLWAMFGTIGFCFSNDYAIHISHTQLNAICFSFGLFFLPIIHGISHALLAYFVCCILSSI